MDLLKSWQQKDWQEADFLYEKETVLKQLSENSRSDIYLLIKKYKRVLYFSVFIFFLCLSSFALVLQTPDLIVPLSIIFIYSCVMAAHTIFVFTRFKLPDLSIFPKEAILQTLTLAKSINAFQLNTVILMTPLTFLSSLIATLVFAGHSVISIFSNPYLLIIIFVVLGLLFLLKNRFKKYISNRQCNQLIRNLEENLKELESL